MFNELKLVKELRAILLIAVLVIVSFLCAVAVGKLQKTNILVITTLQEQHAKEVLAFESTNQQLRRDLERKGSEVYELKNKVTSKDIKIQEVQTSLFSKEQDISHLKWEVDHLRYSKEQQERQITFCQEERRELRGDLRRIQNECQRGIFETLLGGVGMIGDMVFKTGPQRRLLE